MASPDLGGGLGGVGSFGRVLGWVQFGLVRWICTGLRRVNMVWGAPLALRSVRFLHQAQLDIAKFELTWLG